MAHIFRLKTILTGFAGGPGVTTMYFRDVNTAVSSVNQFWLSAGLLIPVAVNIKVDNLGDVIEDSTGDLVDNWLADPVAGFAGGTAGAYAAPAGGAITWETGTIRNSHRLRGRTFVVPLVATAYEANGSLTADAITSLTSAAAGLLATQNTSFCIWHRPFAGAAATATKPARAPYIGSNSLVTGGIVRDRVAVLRSRQG